MKILLINQSWFAPELRAAGHEVHCLGTMWKLDSQVSSFLLHIDEVIDALPNGFVPDRIVVLDNSAPVVVTGLEECPIPCVFLSVDTHHHASQHRFLWHLFDYMFVAQRDYMSQFDSVGATPEWMPLWASEIVQPVEEKEHGAIFVGTLNSTLNPDRVKFFEALQQKVPIKVMSGNWAALFPRSRVVVNQTVKGDLNFRVFESMISGAALLTEKSGNGLDELFVDGEQLVLYSKGNVDDAAERIRELLGDPARTRRIAEAGRAEVQRAHLPLHRATRLLEVLTPLQRVRRPLRHFSAMANYAELARKFLNLDGKLFTKSIAHCLKAATAGLEHNEPLSQELGCLALVCAQKYDTVFGSAAGRNLIGKMTEQYPTILALRLANLRNVLNWQGRDEAVKLATTITPNSDTLLEQADRFVVALSEEVWGREALVK